MLSSVASISNADGGDAVTNGQSNLFCGIPPLPEKAEKTLQPLLETPLLAFPVDGSFKIRVELLDASSTVLELKQGAATTVTHLKELLQAKIGIPSANARFLKKGTDISLHNEHTVAECNLISVSLKPLSREMLFAFYCRVHASKRNPRMGASDSIYHPIRVVPLLVPEAAARRAGSSSRLAGSTRHPMGSQD